MKPETNQIPLSDKPKERSLTQSKPEHTGSIWAHIRHIESRLDANEARVSTVRRDCDRIEKRMQRADAKNPASIPGETSGDPLDMLYQEVLSGRNSSG